ncbi:MAG: hypothetical protein FWC34_08680 [Bacteroidetes bacterium]|nr:hypothetical protein [Bacteroidota bacterium]MCL2302350.1 hypothetical protein [Lentimicrobiaceae bacterium]
MNISRIQSVTYILVGSTLQFAGSVSKLIGLLGFIFLIIGLLKLAKNIDAKGALGAKIILIGAFVGAFGTLIGLIPVVGLVGIIFAIIAFIIEIVGYLVLRGSATIGESGKFGIILILISFIIGIIAFIVGFLPLMGFVAALLAVLAICLLFIGWLNIQKGLIASEFKE